MQRSRLAGRTLLGSLVALLTTSTVVLGGPTAGAVEPRGVPHTVTAAATFAPDGVSLLAPPSPQVVEDPGAVAREETLRPLMGALRDAAGSRLVGATLVHQPTLGIVVTVTAGESVSRVESLAAGHPEVSVRYVENRSRGQLETLIVRYVDEWRTIRPGFLQGVYVGELSGAVEFDVNGSSTQADDFAAVLTSRPELKGVSVLLHPSDGTAGDGLRGGLPLASPSVAPDCTSGFSVLNSGATYSGILTAAHCDSLPLSYGPYGTAGDDLVLANVSSVRNDRADLRFSRRAGVTATPDFYASSSTDIRGVKSSVRRSDMAGSTACHTGWKPATPAEV